MVVGASVVESVAGAAAAVVVGAGVEELVAKMGEAGTKDSWKARKAALDELMAAVDKAGKVACVMKPSFPLL